MSRVPSGHVYYVDDAPVARVRLAGSRSSLELQGCATKGARI
ncbi:MAG TPA: hypothetical protein VHZ95_08545 [Polyangiales bacterium]|nr:hypothetical protein [Polyangiales bacterium]